MLCFLGGHWTGILCRSGGLSSRKAKKKYILSRRNHAKLDPLSPQASAGATSLLLPEFQPGEESVVIISADNKSNLQSSSPVREETVVITGDYSIQLKGSTTIPSPCPSPEPPTLPPAPRTPHTPPAAATWTPHTHQQQSVREETQQLELEWSRARLISETKRQAAFDAEWKARESQREAYEAQWKAHEAQEKAHEAVKRADDLHNRRQQYMLNHKIFQ